MTQEQIETLQAIIKLLEEILGPTEKGVVSMKSKSPKKEGKKVSKTAKKAKKK